MVLYGASGHCKVIIDILEANGVPIDFIVDDNPELTELLGIPVKRNTGSYDEGIISIGACDVRKKIVDSIVVGRYITAIHPSAIISPRAKIGEGCVVMQGAIIQSCAVVGAPGFFRGSSPQTIHNCVSKGLDLSVCQKCCTFAPYSIKV